MGFVEQRDRILIVLQVVQQLCVLAVVLTNEARHGIDQPLRAEDNEVGVDIFEPADSSEA